MSLSKKKRERIKISTAEQHINRLVLSVRDNDNEQAFKKLKDYLDFYIKFFGYKYKIPGCDSEEIEQECLVALRYKAIDDFNPARGKFRSFAILCIRRHLFSLIKSGTQQKRRVLNESLSLNEDHSDGGDNLSLINLVVKEEKSADEEVINQENKSNQCNKLLAKLSKLEKEVFLLYIQQYHYEEIAFEVKKLLKKKITKKTVDNALCRIKLKAHQLAKNMDFSE